MTKVDKRTKEYRDSLGEQPIAPLFKATLKMNDTEYRGEGNTIEEAVGMINPTIFKTLAYLTIEKGEKKAEIRFGTFQCKRFFNNESTKKIKCEQFRRLLV